ncbi:MarR family winged helix-turn-helix transcriptional regulator [Streptomyces sp. NPDC059398]|uniref:MarR family winged helix-turn-helix transcriptional regulator n=1 Tax=Streptomyces sp. NPDC059398 TaxID=3346820 RepID=UPI0036945D1B
MALSGKASAPRSPQAADVASEVIELLEVLWEHGRDAVSPAPASASQLRVLYTLDREEGINQRSLGEVLGAAPSSVSRLCDRLQALGFVERSPSPVSRRELELRLTPQGRTYLRDLRARREEALLASIAAMPPAAQRALVEGLTGFRRSLETTSPVRAPERSDSRGRAHGMSA